jgi:predicted metal-dependent HD superfamily phosphohydrolase
VLKRFLERPVIYPEASFAKRLDRMARENLAREITVLE